MKEVNIDLVVRENYQEIINKTYKWKDEEIIAIYKFITNFINKNEMFFTNKEDMIQDLIWVFFYRVIGNFNINNSTKITTYATKAFKNYCMDYSSRKIREIDRHTISLQTPVNDENILQELLESQVNAEQIEEYIDKKKIIFRLKELFKNDQIMCDYCFDKIAYSKSDIARKYNKSRVAIGKYINNKLKKAMKDEIIKKLLEGYIDNKKR